MDTYKNDYKNMKCSNSFEVLYNRLYYQIYITPCMEYYLNNNRLISNQENKRLLKKYYPDYENDDFFNRYEDEDYMKLHKTASKNTIKQINNQIKLANKKDIKFIADFRYTHINEELEKYIMDIILKIDRNYINLYTDIDKLKILINFTNNHKEKLIIMKKIKPVVFLFEKFLCLDICILMYEFIS